MSSVFHSDSSSLPLLVSSRLTSLLTRWPVVSNYCLSFFLSLSATLMPLLPCGSLHAIPLFLISFIEIARQKSLLITYKFPRWLLLMKWSQKRFDQKKKKKKSNDWKYRGTLYREGGDLLTALPSVSNYFVQMSRHSWTWFPHVFPWLTPSRPKCWTEKCKVYRRTTPERTLWNPLTLSIFSPTAPGSMCPNWKPQLLKAINAMDFWPHCCFSAHFDFHWCRPLHHWRLINCKIVCGMNHERNDMLTEVVTFQMDVFIE